MRSPAGEKYRALHALDSRWTIGANMKSSVASKIIGTTLAVALTTGFVPSAVAFANEADGSGSNDGSETNSNANQKAYQSEEEYKQAVTEANEVPEGVTPVTMTSSETVNGATTSVTTNASSWTSEDKSYKYKHEKVVTTTDSKGEATSNTTVVVPGHSETLNYKTPVFDHVDENGNNVFRTGETSTYSDVVVTTTNDNASSSTHVVETTTKIQVVMVNALDENGNPVTQIKTDADGNPVLVPVYDAEGNVIDKVPSDAEGNPVQSNIYYEDGTLVSFDDANYTEATDEDGNRLYLDSNNLVTTEASTDIEATADDYDYSKSETITSIDGGLYKNDQDLLKIKELLGDYGITAQEMQINEAITNINVGTLTSCGNQTGSRSDSVYGDASQGQTMRVENIAEGAVLGLKNAVAQVLLGAGASESQLDRKEGLNPVISSIASDDRTVEDTRTQVVALAEALMKNDSQISIERYAAEGGSHNKKQLDFTGIANDSESTDVVYTTLTLGDQVAASATIEGSLTTEKWVFQNDFASTTGFNVYYLPTAEAQRAYVEYVNAHGYGNLTLKEKTIANIEGIDQDGYLYIYINEDQVAVINVDTSSLADDKDDAEIDLSMFTVIVKNADGSTSTYDGSQGAGKKVSQQIVLNFGNYSGTIKSTGCIFGTVIAPNANYISASQSAGQLVCNTYKDTGGAWHYTGTSVVENNDVITTYYKTLQNMPLWNVVANERENVLQETEVVVDSQTNEYDLTWKSQNVTSEPTGGDETVSYTTTTEKPWVSPLPGPDDPEDPDDPQNPEDPEEQDQPGNNGDSDDSDNPGNSENTDSPEKPNAPKHSNDPSDKIAYAKHAAVNSQDESLAKTGDNIGSGILGLCCMALAGAIGAGSSLMRRKHS